jgi:hypothetical protein
MPSGSHVFERMSSVEVLLVFVEVNRPNVAVGEVGIPDTSQFSSVDSPAHPPE